MTATQSKVNNPVRSAGIYEDIQYKVLGYNKMYKVQIDSKTLYNN